MWKWNSKPKPHVFDTVYCRMTLERLCAMLILFATSRLIQKGSFPWTAGQAQCRICSLRSVILWVITPNYLSPNCSRINNSISDLHVMLSFFCPSFFPKAEPPQLCHAGGVLGLGPAPRAAGLLFTQAFMSWLSLSLVGASGSVAMAAQGLAQQWHLPGGSHGAEGLGVVLHCLFHSVWW